MDKFKKIQESLAGIFGDVIFKADGYLVHCVKRTQKERLVVEVYVDGWIKGEWSRVDDKGDPVHPQGRFWQPCRARAYPLKQYPKLKRAMGKAWADKATCLRTYACLPTWNSSRSLVSHLRKHFPDLQIVEKSEAGALVQGELQ